MQTKGKEGIVMRPLWLANLFRLLKTNGEIGGYSADVFSNST